MKKNIKKILVLCLAVVMLVMPFTTVFAATVYYYFGYYYTYITSDKVSLYGIDSEVFDLVFVPDTLNNLPLVDIDNSAFINNTDIRLIDFGGAANLERIGSFAFSGCTNVTGEIKIPSNVIVIETAAFQNCSSVESVVYNATCGYVPNQCFYGCTALSSVTLNDSVAGIGSYAFADCPNLTYMDIPASVTDIADTAFMNDTVTLGVYYDSAAYWYALDKGINYEVLDPENIPTEPPTEPTEPETEPPTEAPVGYLLGDTDNSDYIDVVDATWIQRYAAQMDVTPVVNTIMHGDVDDDGEATVLDATFIMRYSVDIDTPYPIGERIV